MQLGMHDRYGVLHVSGSMTVLTTRSAIGISKTTRNDRPCAVISVDSKRHSGQSSFYPEQSADSGVIVMGCTDPSNHAHFSMPTSYLGRAQEHRLSIPVVS